MKAIKKRIEQKYEIPKEDKWKIIFINIVYI